MIVVLVGQCLMKTKKNWKESMDKLRQEGKLVVWNKGLTPRKGKYKKHELSIS